MAASMPEALHYTRRSAMYYHGGSQALLPNNNINVPAPAAAPKRKIYRTTERAQLFGRRQDGVYVRYEAVTVAKHNKHKIILTEEYIVCLVPLVAVTILQINKDF
jgi:hypothetical protein